MRKDTYNCHFIGNKRNPKIILVHGMGFYWKKCFENIIEKLKDKYFMIIPELPGHRNEEDKKAKIAIMNIVSGIEAVLRKKKVDSVDLAYGISFGATIVTELCDRQIIHVSMLVLDGAQFVNMGWKCKISAFVMTLQFKRILSKKYMNSYVKKQLGYENKDEIKILSKMMNDKIGLKTLYQSAYECYKYNILKKKKYLIQIKTKKKKK